MKLEFNHQTIPAALYQELDIKGYLALFDIHMPVLPQMLLNLMDKKHGTEYFDQLKALEEQISLKKIDLKTLITKSSKLPFLDYALPYLKNKSLEPYHLFDLGQFILKDHDLVEAEKGLQELGADKENKSIRDILDRFTINRFSGMRLTKVQKKLKQEIEEIDQSILDALSIYEKQIRKETGLDMIHPYPKEIFSDDRNLEKIRSCHLLVLTDKGGTLLVDYRLPDHITGMIREKKKKDDAFTASVNTILSELNEALYPFYEGFNKYYEERKKRVYAYVMLWVKKNHGLCFPDFQETGPLCLEKGILPVLKKQQPKKYIPLTLELEHGASVLFGANMTGKTTVLKTLYFHLVAVKAGLPVPAALFRLVFPDEIALHLKSSGNLQSGLSGFGEDITFFCHEFNRHAYVLVDELFQSTDPVTGSTLSEIIIKEFHSQDLFFFCTSHYPDILKIKGPVCLRMKDFSGKRKTDYRDLLSYIPYEVEKLPLKQMETIQEQMKTSLSIALMFPLPDNIKKRIKLGIKGDYGQNSP